MTAPGAPTCAPAWLALRESADHAARDTALAEQLAAHLAGRLPARSADEIVVRDLGCGTGSMGRWLAPRLAGPQRWVLHDRDPDLLALAAASMPTTAGRHPVRTGVAVGELAAVGPADLAGADVVVASALFDLLTASEVDRLARSSAAVGAAVLISLSVTGEVALDPPDPLDGAIAEAFDAHQRREHVGRRLLGPDAPREAAAAFVRHGFDVVRAPTPWRLGPGDRTLAEEWLRGRVDAAVAQVPALARAADAWSSRRLAAFATSSWHVEVGHVDLLALPGKGR